MRAELAEIEASGLAHHAGRLPQAEACYRKILAVEPSNLNALHLLGVLARQAGQPRVAVDLISKAVALNGPCSRASQQPRQCASWTWSARPRPSLAAQALALRPDYAAALNNLGNTLQGRGEHSQAEACYRQVLALDPAFGEAQANPGAAPPGRAQPAEAEARARRALALKPDLALAYGNLGHALSMQGRSAQAEASCRRALALEPNYPEGHNNLGNALKDQGRLEEAEVQLSAGARPQAGLGRGARQSRPGIEGSGAGSPMRKLAIAGPSRSGPASPTRSAVSVACCSTAARSSPHWRWRNGRFGSEEDSGRQGPVRAVRRPSPQGRGDPRCGPPREQPVARLAGASGRPSKLAAFVARVLKHGPTIGACIKRVNEAWPSRPSEAELARARRLADDARQRALLISLLKSTPVCDIELERFSTAARFSLLRGGDRNLRSGAAHEAKLKAGCALARQCFVNQYVFGLAEGELEQVVAAAARH